jgi:hypothetical protein
MCPKIFHTKHFFLSFLVMLGIEPSTFASILPLSRVSSLSYKHFFIVEQLNPTTILALRTVVKINQR